MNAIQSIIVQARIEQRTCLGEAETKEVLQAWGLPVAACCAAQDAADAVRLAGQIGYPVVLKVSSPRILHKSDIGGVRVGLNSAGEVAAAYAEILARARPLDPAAAVTVQPLVEPGVEVIVGVTRDPHFGPVLMFGLGGIFAELLKDVCFRMIPICQEDAASMLQSLQAAALLAGYRGRPPADKAAIALILGRVSDLIQAHPEIGELDLNPVIVHEQGAVIADARAVLAG